METGLAPGIYSETTVGGAMLITLVGGNDVVLATVTVMRETVGGEIPPEIRTMFNRWTAHDYEVRRHAAVRLVK